MKATSVGWVVTDHMPSRNFGPYETVSIAIISRYLYVCLLVGWLVRQKYNYHIPSSNLSLCEKVVYFTGIKVFNNLPPSIKNLSNDTKQFKLELKNYLHAH
jgi:hypothetical protein